MQNGVLAGYPLIGLKATVYDGSYRERRLQRDGVQDRRLDGRKHLSQKGGAVLLEPVMKVEVVTPEDYMGDVMGDLNRRRGLIQGMEDTPAGKVIRAEVPLGEMFGYAHRRALDVPGARELLDGVRPLCRGTGQRGRGDRRQAGPLKPPRSAEASGGARLCRSGSRIFGADALAKRGFDAPWMLNYKTSDQARTYTVTRMANRCLLQRLPAVPAVSQVSSIS